MKRISTRGMSRPEWLALRKKTIGGSDAAAIVGMSKYSSPYSVWADKMGLTPDKPDTEAMRIGRDLEQYVADRWMEATGKKCQKLEAMLYNPAYPFAAANIDRRVIGEKAGLECKTTSSWNAAAFHQGTEFPERYYCQCVHYLAVTGWDRWYLSVVVLGEGHYTYCLERDQTEIDALMTAEAGFWGHVMAKTPPDMDGHKATTETLGQLYKGGAGDVDLLGMEDHFRFLQRYEEMAEQYKTAAEGERNAIKEAMGDADHGSCAGFKCSWKPQTRRTFDQKKLAKDYPEIDLAAYYKIGSSRPFKWEAV